MATVLELRDVIKEFPGHRAVDRVSLSVPRGEFFSLVGPSGCGKTTLLRLIAGFESPTSGAIALNGRDVAGLPPHRREVSTVFQNYALFPHLSVERNVAFGLERRRAPKSEIRSRVADALALVHLSEKCARLPHQISGGERQRVALARSLVLEPSVLLLDEPLSALDPQLRRQMRAELKALQRRVGIAFLFITHDQEEALSLSDRMAVMNRGSLVETGAPIDLYARPASRFTAEFLGDVNWIDGAAIRPEALRLSPEPIAGLRSMPGIVEKSTFLGNARRLHVQLPGGAACVVEARLHDAPFAPGDAVHLSWRPEDELPRLEA